MGLEKSAIVFDEREKWRLVYRFWHQPWLHSQKELITMWNAKMMGFMWQAQPAHFISQIKQRVMIQIVTKQHIGMRMEDRFFYQNAWILRRNSKFGMELSSLEKKGQDRGNRKLSSSNALQMEEKTYSSQQSCGISNYLVIFRSKSGAWEIRDYVFCLLSSIVNYFHSWK